MKFDDFGLLTGLLLCIAFICHSCLRYLAEAYLMDSAIWNIFSEIGEAIMALWNLFLKAAKPKYNKT